MARRLRDGVSYPFRSERSVDLLAIGGVLGLITAMAGQLGAALGASNPLLALPFAALALAAVVGLLGYLVRVFGSTADGDDAPPAFGPPGALVRAGSRLFAVSLAYAMLLAALVGGTIRLLARLPLAPDAIDLGGLALFLGLSTAALVVVLAVGYTYPAVVGHLAAGTSLRRVLDLRAQRSVLAHGSYCIAWLFATLVVVPGWAFLIAGLSSPTAFGVGAVFVAFYAHVVATRIVASGYRSAATR